MNAPEDFFEKNLVRIKVKLLLDGKEVEAFEGETILELADREGKSIPRLCYKEGYRKDGNCRSCMVEIKGERVLAPSCCRNVKEGMEVFSENERSRKSQN